MRISFLSSLRTKQVDVGEQNWTTFDLLIRRTKTWNFMKVSKSGKNKHKERIQKWLSTTQWKRKSVLTRLLTRDPWVSSPLLSYSPLSLLVTTFSIHQMKFADFNRKKTAKVSNCINLQKKDFVTFVLKKKQKSKSKNK